MTSRAPLWPAAPPRAKVAHVVLGLNVGGLERVVLRLLERTCRARYAPWVVALQEPGELAPELVRLDVPLVVLPRRPGLDARLAVELSSWLRREGVLLVHTHNPSPHVYGAFAAAIARSAARPRGAAPRVVHTKHGRNDVRSPRKVLVNRLASSLTDRIVAVSDDARAVAVEVEHVDPDKVVTIANGVDPDEYRPGGDPRFARARLGTPLSGFHVGCVARLAPEKDHATLLAAFAELRRARPDAHLTLIGDGPLRSALEARAAALGLAGAVTFAGTRADVPALLAAFDVFALASLTEGISLTLIEAAAAGLPVVATRVGGNAEIVGDGESGLLVPPDAPGALARALDAVARRGDRRELGLRGRARVIDRFGVDRMARAYDELYRQVLARGAAERGAPPGG